MKYRYDAPLSRISSWIHRTERKGGKQAEKEGGCSVGDRVDAMSSSRMEPNDAILRALIDHVSFVVVDRARFQGVLSLLHSSFRAASC